MGECSTQIEQCFVEFKWTIQQFSLHLQRHDDDDNRKLDLKSSTFTSKICNREIKWMLKLYVKEFNEELIKKWISINCTVASKDYWIIIDSHEINFVNDTSEKHLVIKSDKHCSFANTGCLTHEKFYGKDKILEDADTLLPNDTLTIIFKAVVGSHPFLVIGPKPIELPECKVLDDYVDLFSSREGSDVTFTVGEEKIKAHKLILMTRSVVFAAMFKHDMIENEENSVTITDIKPEVFRELLRFIYTNQVYRINELAEDLLHAADKYQVKMLKRICEHELLISLNVKNAARILIHADYHDCPQLKTHTINFINKHGLDVIDTPGFKIMKKNHVELIAELYSALVISSTIKVEA